MHYSPDPAADLVDLLDRLYLRLTERAAELPSPASEEFTIGDLYLRLIPYRGIRGDLGVLELAEYEHALLRLLAGERGYVDVLDRSVREEFQRELASVNPILGIYRDYAAASLRLIGASPADVNGAKADVTDPPPRIVDPAPFASEDVERSAAPDRLPRPPAAPQPSALERPIREPVRHSASSAFPATPSEELDPVGAPSPDDTAACKTCERTLPPIGTVRFCPYCGAAQGTKPCPRCSTPVEAGWSFCIQCGTGRDS